MGAIYKMNSRVVIILSALFTLALAGRASDMARFTILNRQIEADYLMNAFSLSVVCVFDNLGVFHNVPYTYTSACLSYQILNSTYGVLEPSAQNTLKNSNEYMQFSSNPRLYCNQSGCYLRK